MAPEDCAVGLSVSKVSRVYTKMAYIVQMLRDIIRYHTCAENRWKGVPSCTVDRNACAGVSRCRTR